MDEETRTQQIQAQIVEIKALQKRLRTFLKELENDRKTARTNRKPYVVYAHDKVRVYAKDGILSAIHSMKELLEEELMVHLTAQNTS